MENAGNIAHFSCTYEKVNNTDSLQPSGSNGPLVIGKIAHFSCTYEKVNKTDSLQPSGSNGPLVTE